VRQAGPTSDTMVQALAW